MSVWGIAYSDKTVSQLEIINRPIRQQILNRLEWLASNFDTIQPTPLHGEWKGFFKLRIGDWRVVYDFESAKQLIRVHQIDRRDKVYKKRK